MATETLERSKRTMDDLQTLVACVHRIAQGRDTNDAGLMVGAVLLHERPELVRSLRDHVMVSNNALARSLKMQPANLSATVNGHRALTLQRAEQIVKAVAAELAPERAN